MAENLTAAQRAAYFNASTRENIHTIGKQTATGELANMTFTFPKARLLSKVYLDVTATVKVKGTAGKVADIDVLTPYKVLKRVGISLNNGFDPFVISGEKLALLNLIQMHPNMVIPAATGTNCTFDGLTASTEGTSNTFNFCLEVPLTINEASNTGLILLQNAETMVQLSIDTAAPADVLKKDGYTVEVEKVEVKPTLVSFTIPSVEQAFPDLSVLKLVSAKTEEFVGSGENIVKLNVGTIYRKLVLYITDKDGNPVEDADITSNIQILFNQADTPYNVDPRTLRYINAAHLGMTMPKGVYMFDFSSQGQMANVGGSRDLIDTERLQEFWVKFSTTEGGKITVISENLTRLK